MMALVCGHPCYYGRSASNRHMRCDETQIGRSTFHPRCPLTFHDEDIPEHLAAELARHQQESGAGLGAICGALGYGIVFLIFTFLPAARLAWDLNGSWGLIIAPAMTLTVGTACGALFGAAVLSALSATIASSSPALQGAKRGFIVGCVCGAAIGAGCVFLQNAVTGGPAIDFAWIVQSSRITGTAITVGSLFAVLGSLAGAIACRPETRTASHSTAALGDAGGAVAGNRYQFGILRILTLTAAIAVVIAVPLQILARLKRISQLGAYAIDFFEVLMVAVVLLIPTLVVWAVMRGPLLYARLASAIISWRGLKHHRDELEKSVTRRD